MLKHIALSGLALLALAACGRNKGAADLPDEATFYMQAPEDEAGETSTASSALCQSAEAHQQLLDRIKTYNEAVQDRIALIKAMIKAGERAGANGEVTKTVTKNGFTATFDAKNDGAGNINYTVTIEAQGAAPVTVLTGTSKDDLSAGSWDFQGLTQSRTVHVDWTNVDGTLTVNRDAKGDFGERTSKYVRTATTVDVTFTGPQADASAHWDRATLDGEITINGNEICFASDPTNQSNAGGYCNVPCTAGGEGEGEGEGEGGQ